MAALCVAVFKILQKRRHTTSNVALIQAPVTGFHCALARWNTERTVRLHAAFGALLAVPANVSGPPDVTPWKDQDQSDIYVSQSDIVRFSFETVKRPARCRTTDDSKLSTHRFHIHPFFTSNRSAARRPASDAAELQTFTRCVPLSTISRPPTGPIRRSSRLQNRQL